MSESRPTRLPLDKMPLFDFNLLQGNVVMDVITGRSISERQIRFVGAEDENLQRVDDTKDNGSAAAAETV